MSWDIMGTAVLIYIKRAVPMISFYCFIYLIQMTIQDIGSFCIDFHIFIVIGGQKYEDIYLTWTNRIR